MKDLYERIEVFALSSDAPATTWGDPDNPFMSIQAAAHFGAPAVDYGSFAYAGTAALRWCCTSTAR